MDPVDIEMIELGQAGHAGLPWHRVVVQYREGGGADIGGDAQAPGQSFDKMGLARPKIAVQQDNVAAFQVSRQDLAQPHGFFSGGGHIIHGSHSFS